MQNNLVIVESPAKAKTIGKFLGKDYKVMSSYGHIRDLKQKSFSIDTQTFQPEYEIPEDKQKIVESLRNEAKKTGNVWLASDEDREGEAISWHLAFLLGIDPSSNCRIVFNEITKDTIKAAVKNPRPIDLRLVDAQQARRVLDRLVGYQISPLLWRKVRRGLSAGRVQSAALKVICDREKQIEEFVPKEYWNVNARFKKGKTFEARLSEHNGKKFTIQSKEHADEVLESLKNGKFLVSDIVNKERMRKPSAPFTTSSLQQDAANKLGYTTKKTMMVAQQLYEGMEIKGYGTLGLVTYIRTDSVRISDEAKIAAKNYINSNFGSEYYANNVFSNKKKDIQDAHEAIRPSIVELDPELIKESLTKEQYQLYKLIWTRFIASQMSAARFDSMQVTIETGNYSLKANGSRLLFDGYQRVYSSGSEEDKDKILPELEKGEELKPTAINGEQKFSEPPARFTEASLVKFLEEKNIGRPSTYAPIIGTILERKYITRQKKTLAPTELGFVVTDLIEEYFKEIADIGFTADMEDKLDDVEAKGNDWKQIIRDFYKTLKEELDIADKAIEKVELEDQLTDELCEICGKPMAIKSGRFGDFLACSGYPECKNTKAIVKKIGITCPDCGGDIVAKRGKSGKIFYGCNNYPSCTRAYWYKPTEKKCPECGELLLERNSRNAKLVCSNDKCGYKE